MEIELDSVRVSSALNRAFLHTQLFGHPEIGAQHVLLALVEDGQCVAGEILARLGLTPGAAADVVRRSAPQIAPTPDGWHYSFTREAETALLSARVAARIQGINWLSSEDLLEGLVAYPNGGTAGRILAELGVGIDQVREQVAEARQRGHRDPDGPGDVVVRRVDFTSIRNRAGMPVGSVTMAFPARSVSDPEGSQ